ncbi:hypothetical protein Ddc_02785 [Ditylenchus destructor]|nr:hypothetical protein Ddc_02785 [Ditylenchus destructor]
MLFLNNRPVDIGCDTKYSNYVDNSPPRYLQKFTIILTAIYIFLSAAMALFHYPISATCLIIPFLMALVVTYAVMTNDDNNLWFAAIAGTLGALGKILAIVTYSMVFGIGSESAERHGTSAHVPGRPYRDNDGFFKESAYIQFFIVLLTAEAFLLMIIACIRCNLAALRRCFRYSS